VSGSRRISSAIPCLLSPSIFDDTRPVVWRDGSQVEPGNGNHTFFELARSLKLAGMNYPEIETTLRSEADHAYTPSERKAEIAGLIRDLRELS
jgi:hypothetical protein